MGCDIHARVEVKRNIKEVEKWTDADYYEVNAYYDENNKDWGEKYDVVSIYPGRNYQLFATLAGVRNYGGTEPIDEPRGIPDDSNENIKKDYESWGLDAHTPSWFTLKELMEYQATAPIAVYSGFVSPREASELDILDKKPTEWCQGTSDETWVRRTWKEKSEVLVPLIDAMKQRLKDVLWLYDDERIPEFADKIRVVFWFDN